ncbi:ArnT family glycosyltransferase [Nakamurella deserti]|uniref:ArnT family glycosyltransferase n=1 Tax=Nakamurella deserti TaxID=2164074 RepID=UPI000DBE270A|nr:glycosyltransferase family 39 protein [Nakamurella deserti]
MTTTLSAPDATTPPTPTWQLAVGSFLPPEKRSAAQRWIRRVPLTVVLLIQLGMSLRLSNSAYRDEALYIWTGHRMFQHWFDGAVLYDNPSQYFSGSPSVYPALAALLDSAGGLETVRALSVVCMLSATFSIYCFTHRFWGHRAGLAAALAFALAGPTHHLGRFATFDAMALALLAGACALGVRSAQNRSLRWAPLVGAMLALAVMTKYAALMFVPVVLAVTFLSVTWRGTARRLHAKNVALVALATTAGLLALFVATVGAEDYAGFRSTTSGRSGTSIVLPDSPWGIVVRAAGFAGPWFVLAFVGAVVAIVRFRRYGLAVVLLAAAVAPVAYQALIGEAVSIEKHIDFGLVFAAPLIGVLAMRTAQPWRKFVMLGAVVTLLISGAATSARIYDGWSNTRALTDTLEYKFRAAPYIRTLGEPFEPVRYAFNASTEYWQWATTDPVQALYYEPAEGPALRGLDAARAGLSDGYWQVVYFNGSTGASQELEPLLAGFGYTLTDTVPLISKDKVDVYRIWQRFQ